MENEKNALDDAKTESKQSDLEEQVKTLNKELKVNKTRLEKLEERYLAQKKETKSVSTDRDSLVSFLKSVVPESMHDSFLNKKPGDFNASDLNRLWVILDSQKENEFQKLVNKNKNEISDLINKNQLLKRQIDELQVSNSELSSKIKDFACLEAEKTESKKVIAGIEEEKNHLLMIIEEKDAEIERLSDLETEIAEMRAKQLMSNKKVVEVTVEKPKVVERVTNCVCLKSKDQHRLPNIEDDVGSRGSRTVKNGE